MSQTAIVLRISPSEDDRVSLALERDQILIGWARAAGLLNPALTWEQFRQIVHNEYYSQETSLRKAGSAAGHLWRFIREIEPGSLVVVPHWSEFYVGEVTGSATYDPSKVEGPEYDTAYRRVVRWLNGKKPIKRSIARVALLSRMKVQGTSANASDLIDEIRNCLSLAGREESPAFHSDLQQRLMREALAEIRSGRIEDYGFESLIKTVLVQAGAKDVQIVPRSKDQGADLIAVFRIADAFQFTVAVQAKHWQPDPPVGREVVEQLIRGIEAEGADLGMVVTSGTISPSAEEAAAKYLEERGVRIELVDGEQFAKLIVEYGIRAE